MSVTCMGGWACPKRDRCQLHEPRAGSVPIERLCEPDTFDCFLPAAPTPWVPPVREAA